MSTAISSLGERALIARLHARLDAPPAHVRTGIGDDAAVLMPDRGMQTVLTTDSLVEQVHFRRDWTTASSIGHKALAVNLSDIAAMGATPRASLLSLLLPADLSLDDFDALIDGYAALSRASATPLIGGNISRSPGPLVLDVTVLGSVRPRRLLLRSGARDGDELFVTGALGAAAAGLVLLGEGHDRVGLAADEVSCIEHQERPTPRLHVGRLVARTSAASAAMDLSDGIADAAATIASASGVGVVIEAAALPYHPGVADVAARQGRSISDFVLSGGEDYELAFAVPVRRRSRFLLAARRAGQIRVTRIGRFETAPGAWIQDADGRRAPLPAGFGHF